MLRNPRNDMSPELAAMHPDSTRGALQNPTPKTPPSQAADGLVLVCRVTEGWCKCEEWGGEDCLLGLTSLTSVVDCDRIGPLLVGAR